MSTTNPVYFVTRSGLAAAVENAEVLGSLKSVLLSQAAPRTVGELKKRGLIAPEKRKSPPRVDHNVLVLEGAIDRIREVVKKTAPKPAPTNERQLAPRIGYVAVRPGSSPRDLTPSTELVYKAIGKRPKQIAEIQARAKSVHPNTVRWAVQILRQRRLVKSIELPE